MMSGSALSPWSMSTQSTAVKYAQDLARALICPVEHKGFKRMVECLRDKKLEEIMNYEPIGPTFLPTFGPTIDGIILPSDLIASMSSFDPLFNGHSGHSSGRGEKVLLLFTFPHFWEFEGVYREFVIGSEMSQSRERECSGSVEAKGWKMNLFLLNSSSVKSSLSEWNIGIE